MTTTEQILAILEEKKALADAAMPGPWVEYLTDIWPPGWMGVRAALPSDSLGETHIATVGRQDDFEGLKDLHFIADARDTVPRLERALRRAVDGLNNNDVDGWDNGASAAILSDILRELTSK